MGNTSLEDTERRRGEQAISAVLEQLIQALAVVAAKAEVEKAVVDTARIDAEVQRKTKYNGSTRAEISSGSQEENGLMYPCTCYASVLQCWACVASDNAPEIS